MWVKSFCKGRKEVEKTYYDHIGVFQVASPKPGIPFQLNLTQNCLDYM